MAPLAKEYLLSKKKGSFLPASDKLKDFKPLAKRQQQKVQHQWTAILNVGGLEAKCSFPGISESPLFEWRMTTGSHSVAFLSALSAGLSMCRSDRRKSPKNWRQSSRKHRPSAEKEERIVKAKISSESDICSPWNFVGSEIISFHPLLWNVS